MDLRYLSHTEKKLILLHSDGLNFLDIFLWLKSSLMFMYTSQKENICFLKSHSKTSKNYVGLGKRESLSNLLTTNVPFIYKSINQ